MSTEIFRLSPFDQFMFPCYIRLILCFPLDQVTGTADIVDILQHSLDNIHVAIPWLAASVRCGSTKGDEPVLVTHPSDRIPFIVNRIEQDMPVYSELAAQLMPQIVLQDEKVSRCGVFPDSAKDSSPSFVLQANFIGGGLLLTFAAHHCVMDGTALGKVIGIFARLCSGSASSSEEIESFCPIRDRERLFQGGESVSLDDFKIHGLSQYIITKSAFAFTPPIYLPVDPKIATKLFYFTNSSLSKLKQSCQPTTGESWISTNNALCALIWTSVTRARKPDPKTTTMESKTLILATPVNIRRRMSPTLADAYLGNAFLDILTPSSTHFLLNSPLSATASRLRSSITAVDSSYIRRVISLFQSTPNLSALKTGPRETLITSWADLPVYDADFGPLLGRPEWVRTPYRASFDGCGTILPRRMQGLRVGTDEAGIEVCLELFGEDMDRLLADEGFMRWVDVVID